MQLIMLTASDILFCTSLAGRKGEAPHTAHPAHRLRHPLLHIPCGQEGHALVDPLVEVELLAGQEGEGARVRQELAVLQNNMERSISTLAHA